MTCAPSLGPYSNLQSSSKGSGYAGPCRLPGGSSHQLGELLVQVALGGGSFVQEIDMDKENYISMFFLLPWSLVVFEVLKLVK